jgi:hypothetical protein
MFDDPNADQEEGAHESVELDHAARGFEPLLGIWSFFVSVICPVIVVMYRKHTQKKIEYTPEGFCARAHQPARFHCFQGCARKATMR